MKTTAATLLLALVLAGGTALPALAHKVVAGAYAAGDHIEGEIGFSDGTMAGNALVEVLAEDGSKLGETRTAQDGTFTFTPTRRAVLIFHADLGSGHVAEVRLEPSELPASLAAAGAGGSATAAAGPAATEAAAGGSETAAAALRVTDAQRAALAEAVRNEVRPLRREIIALKERNDMQSILGGLGYIAGLFGLWFFLSARRQGQKKAQG